MFGNEKLLERPAYLEKIKDNYRKIVVSMDRDFIGGRNGIEHCYLADFLLQPASGNI